MKKFIYSSLIVLLALICCEDKTKDFKLDPNATVLLKAAKNVQTRSGGTHLTPLEIVQQAEGIMFYNVPIFGEKAVGRGFSAAQRDYETPALKMWGTDIIDYYGDVVPAFIESRDCILRKITNADKPNMVIDTIAYIPNSVMRAAEIAIKQAHANEDYEAVYNLFNDAFTFIPIHGYEWQALKAKGMH